MKPTSEHTPRTPHRPQKIKCEVCGVLGHLETITSDLGRSSRDPGRDSFGIAIYYPAGDDRPFRGGLCPDCAAKLASKAGTEYEAAVRAEYRSRIPLRYRDATMADLTPARAGDLGRFLAAENLSILTIQGPTGSGKTFMAWAVARKWAEDHPSDDPDRQPAFFSTPELVAMIRAGFGGKGGNGNGAGDIVRRLQGHHAPVIIDDMGAETSGGWFTSEIFRIIDAREAWYRKTILTTNLTPVQITEHLGAAIASRIAGGMRITLMEADRRQMDHPVGERGWIHA